MQLCLALETYLHMTIILQFGWSVRFSAGIVCICVSYLLSAIFNRKFLVPEIYMNLHQMCHPYTSFIIAILDRHVVTGHVSK